MGLIIRGETQGANQYTGTPLVSTTDNDSYRKRFFLKEWGQTNDGIAETRVVEGVVPAWWKEGGWNE
jgi:hypothetical protein